MRASVTSTVLCMILAAAILTPAWAGGPMAHGPSGFHPAPPHPPFTHRHPNQFARGNFVPNMQGVQGIYPFGYFGDDGLYEEAAPAGAPALIMAEPQPVAAPVAVAHYEPPTVETTPQGVTVVRGPGSRHLGP